MVPDSAWRRLVFHKADRIALAERLLERLDLRPGERFLEVGCGMGYASALVSERWRAIGVVATDLSQPYLRDHAVRTAEIMDADVIHVAADAHRLPFRNQCFDAVWTANLLYRLLNPAQAIAEIRRVLRPGGCWIGLERATPLLACRREAARMNRLNDEHGGFERPWPLSAWEAFARRCGLRCDVLPGRRTSAYLRWWLAPLWPAHVVLTLR